MMSFPILSQSKSILRLSSSLMYCISISFFSAHGLISEKSWATNAAIFWCVSNSLLIPKSAFRISMSSAISASIFFELFQMAETLWDIPVSINFSADNMMRVNGVFSSWDTFMKKRILDWYLSSSLIRSSSLIWFSRFSFCSLWYW